MKRMNEVFNLSNSIRYSEWWSYEMIEHADLAIRNVDSLADVLAAAIPALQYNRSISDKADKLYLDAVAALNAYRGEYETTPTRFRSA